MTKPKFDQDFWEQLWSKTLREHADKLARRPPNAHLVAEAANLPPGRALDAGCGHGADTLWLAAPGWRVTAVDFSAAALAHGRSMAEAAGADVAERIDWIESDLATWTAEAMAGALHHVYVIDYGSDVRRQTASDVTGAWSRASQLGACNLPASDPTAFCAGPVVYEEISDPTRPGELAIAYSVGSNGSSTSNPDDYWPRLVWLTIP